MKSDKTFIINKIKEYLKFKNDKDFAEFLGIKQNTLSTWKSRNVIDYDLIIAKCDLIDANWLLTGKGNMLKKQEKQIQPYPENDSFSMLSEADAVYGVEDNRMTMRRLKTDYYNVDKQMIPLYDVIATAGITSLFHDNPNNVPLDFISVPNAPKCDGAIFVRGDSMYPLLKAGDIICYKTIFNTQNIVFGEMYLLDIDNGDDQYLTVKYVQKSDIGNDCVKLVSENRYHAAKDEPIKNIRALAIIKLSIRYNTIS